MNPSDDIIEQAAITQFPSPLKETSMTGEEKKEAIATHIRAVMEILGLDLDHHSLKQTPERVARMYVDEIFSGLDPSTFPRISLFEESHGEFKQGNMIVTRVDIVSFCEHHLVPMIGSAHIGYIPQKTVLGLSKISRIARYFAARPQLQERLTAQIGDSLATILGHDDVIVQVRAQHMCVVARGTKDQNGLTTTLHCSGLFESSHDLRKEFIELIRNT